MTYLDKVDYVKHLLANVEEATDEVVESLLSLAEDKALNTRYPFGVPEDAVLPARYDYLVCELASRYFARRGALGELIHNENGINRTWETPEDADLLKQITPIAKVVM